MSDEKKWYVTRVHNMAFDRVVGRLRALGAEFFFPETYDVRIVNGRKTKVLVPVIRDIIFVRDTIASVGRLIEREKLPLAFYYSHTSHIQNDCLCVRDKEMDDFIRASRALDRAPTIQPFGDIELREGDRIRVLSGPFAGIEGYYVQPRRGQRKHLVLNVSNLLSLTLRLSPTDLIEHI